MRPDTQPVDQTPAWNEPEWPELKMKIDSLLRDSMPPQTTLARAEEIAQRFFGEIYEAWNP